MSFKSFLTMAMAGAVLLTLPACIASKPPVAVSRGTYSDIKPEEHQQLPSRIKMLSLEDAQHIAAQNSPTFKKAYYAISAAKAAYYSSYSGYMPTVTASFAITRSGTEPFNRTAGNPTRKTDFTPGVNLNWLVFDSFQRELNVVASKHNMLAAEA